MIKTRFQFILGLLVVLSAVHANQEPTPQCDAQAWVRVPDLAPNTIVHGDARVKLSAECPAVESVSLGLRFKERSFVKALRFRDDAKRLSLKSAMYGTCHTLSWALTPSRFANLSAGGAYETVTNDDSWIIREEERIVFETTQPFKVETENLGAHRDAVQDFSILVPSTNFPPALDTLSVGLLMKPDNHEIADVEWIYEYFARVSFANGTTKEITAGYTAFQSMRDPTHAVHGQDSKIVELEPSGNAGGSHARSSPVAKYSVAIVANCGLTFSAGTEDHVITGVVTRTGFARAFSGPLVVTFCVVTDSSPKWAAEYGIPSNVVVRPTTPDSILRATPGHGNRELAFGSRYCPGVDNAQIAVVMPNSTPDEIEANEILTTTSAPFTVSIDVDDTHIPNFETYYETLANSLVVHLTTPRMEDELVDPDDPSAEPDPDWGPQFEDDEEAWVPWHKQKHPRVHSSTRRSYTGRVPAMVLPISDVASPWRCRQASSDVSGQVALSGERDYGRPLLTHYLDEGARAPILLDRDLVQELLPEGPAKRELRTPILEPVVSSPLTGEELVCRYYHSDNPRKPLIYVGETWAIKVANKDEREDSTP